MAGLVAWGLPHARTVRTHLIPPEMESLVRDGGHRDMDMRDSGGSPHPFWEAGVENQNGYSPLDSPLQSA